MAAHGKAGDGSKKADTNQSRAATQKTYPGYEHSLIRQERP